MVFESIVVDVLNRFLGDYVENLNHSQLKLGIWGGDVVLENMVLKQNALEELNIPVQTVYGHLGKLTLKIPWKNLYGASVEATVERLLLVVNPNAEVKYDPEKEDKIALEAKHAELLRVEEAKKKETETDKMDETFVEKLVTQIIKNVQLTIKDIHVRYEDSITNPDQPFSLGMTLHNLSVHTTDENWKQTVIQEAVTKICKILSLEGLAIYWNPETELYAKCEPEKIKMKLQQEIATKNSQPSFYSYALGPINATAKLKLNPKPEQDTSKFSIPKVTLSLHMEQLSVSLSKNQYRDMMLMFDSMDRMNRGAPYRRFRPDLKQYHGHYKEWWQFAYTCVLEEDVRRKRKNWDWNHMLEHRQLCKNYATVYQGKLMNKGKVNAEHQKIMDEAEKRLDLLNLVVIRQRIEMEVERLGKLEAEARKSRGWFGGWWAGASSKDEQHSEQTDLLKQFQNAMTPAEKEKLFRAIDYQENSAPLHMPAEYVAVRGEFRLDRLILTLTDETPVLTAAVDAVSLDLHQRPSANALRLDITMHTFTVSGTTQDKFFPKLVVSKEVAHDVHLLNIMFETSPLDKSCDQRVKLSARPLQIVYDAQTVVRIVEVFKPPQESTALTTLQAVAENKFSDLKEKSALGMQYAVHHHTFIDLDVDVAPSYIIIPHHGQYKEDRQCVVIKLGAIRLKSSPRAAGGPLDVARLYKEGLDDDRVLKEIAKHSYDKITLALTQMQIVVAKKGEDWNKAIAADDEGTPLHLLLPTNLIIQIHKCLITDDPRMPKFKVRGELEKIAVSIAQDRLLTLCEILVSMPLPEATETAQLKSSASKASSLSLITKYLDPVEKERRESSRLKKQKERTDETSVQLTELEAFFIIKEATLCVNRTHTNAKGDYEKFIVFGLTSLELTVIQKTFNLEAMVRLGAVSLSHHRGAQKTVFIIETPKQDDDYFDDFLPITDSTEGEYLFTITYCNVDKKCPEFRSQYGSVEQLIELRFTKLKMHLHLQSLQEIMTLVNEYQNRLQDINSKHDRIADSGPLETIVEGEELAATKSKTSITKPNPKKQVESIQIKMVARLGTVSIEFSTERRPLSLVQFEGARAGLVIKASYTELEFNMASLCVMDLNPNTIHKDILKVVGGDVVKIRVVIFNNEVFPVSEVDMSIEAQLNTLRIIFLNWFVSSMLDFLNNFQTAQQAIVDASAQAAEAARERAAQAYQNSTKVLLKVRMAAPIILVPENSKSQRALIVDLGRLNISNRFLSLNVEESERTVSVDELTLELEEMKVSCVYIGGELKGEVQGERKLLRPTTFKLLVKRSLSSWHTALPDLDVSGRIHSITITVGHSDYKSIMKILNQNLSEGVEALPPPPPPSRPVTKSKSALKSQTNRSTVMKSTVAVIEQPAVNKENEALRTTMKFCFTMDSFVINLSHSDPYADHQQYAKDVDFACLSLSLLSLKGRMFSDNSMHTTMLLVNCTMDDTRPKRGSKITRFLERRTRRIAPQTGGPSVGTTTPEKIRSMIDITYTLKNEDTFIDMRIYSFNLILAMDFLNKLAEFATSGLAADERPPEPEPNVTSPEIDRTPKEETADELKAAGERVSVTSKKKLSVVSDPALVEKQPSVTPKSSMMTVNIKIEQPDIILVESLEDRNCEAFVMNMEVRFKLRQTIDYMVADGGISSLQVTARRLDELLGTPDPGPDAAAAVAVPSEGGGERPAPYLLYPTHMSLAISQPPGCGMHVDIAITDIKITISPDMIALMLRVLDTMASTEDQALEQENTTIFYDDLWAIRSFNPNAYWFLKTEEATEALELDEPAEVAHTPVGEICLLSSPSIIIAFEITIGRETIPVLVMQASLQGQVKDWSSDFHMESTWAMQVSHYNIARAEWEPLVEPVERMRDATYRHEPWELKIEMIMRPGDQRAVIDKTDEAETNKAVAHQQANKTITVSSTEPLEITITGTGLEILTMLSNSFSPALDPNASKNKSDDVDNSASKTIGAPYVLHNATGLTAKLLLADNDDFTVFFVERQAKMDYKEVVLEPGAQLPLRLKHPGFGQLKLNEPPPPLKLTVQIIEMQEEFKIPVERADKRYFPLGRHGSPTAGDERGVPHVAMYEPRGLISDISMQDGAVQIYLRSVLQVMNTLAVNVSVYYMTRCGNEVRLLGEVKPGDRLRLPLQAVYTPTAEIFFSVEDFTVSAAPFVWRELQQEVKLFKLLHCNSKDKYSGEKFYLKAVGTMEPVFFEHTNRSTLASSCYDVVLKPAVKMQNCLPLPIVVSQLGLKRTKTFKPGEMFHLSHLAPNKASIVIKIENYLEKSWVCTKNLPEADEFTVWSFESHDSPSVMVLDLGMHNIDQDGTQVLSLYCPFWMLNKTGFTISYRNVDETGNVIFHPKDYKEPILFSFRAKNFYGKKQAAIRLEFGEWSEKFSLDIAGSSGLVNCKLEGRTYQVTVENKLMFNSLTKMVIFRPFFLIINEAPFDIQYQELHRSADPWQTVETNSVSPLWPTIEKDEKLLLLRIAFSTEISAPFLYTEQHSTCLKLDNTYGGLYVEVAVGEDGTYITVRQYHAGHAPALLVNYSGQLITVYEQENVNTRKLPPLHEMLYAWDNPAGPQILIIEAHNNKKETQIEIRQDGIGDFKVDESHVLYWVSFLNGLQRVVLITADLILARGVHLVGEADVVDTEMVLSIHGMGLSLVDDQKMQEVIYISMSNSGIIWEQCKIGGRRYKKLDESKSLKFEDAYQKYLKLKMVGDEPANPTKIDEKTEVNFEEMRITRGGSRLLRRTQEPGLWISYGMSSHCVRIHARLHRLQVDQQLPLPTFPVVLAPVPPPRSIATGATDKKAFMEVSIVERVMEHSKVRQYKYYKVLIQEFHVKVDMGLVTALLNIFPEKTLTEKEALEAFTKDRTEAVQPLASLAANEVANDQKNFYDNLHLSPIKLHVSFSLGGATHLPSFVGTILQSIGVTLTDMNDVVFKLSYYERNFEFLSQKELMSQVQYHYMGQALKQMYVLVLGLDVIGNPYGLVIGLKTGVQDLFYEPFQGAIQGPGEFAEGLYLGMRSLVGHTVGGAAGAVSRITGAMGHGLAALSMDKDYQRRRRDNMNKTPANLQEGLARSGKGLVMGVVDGVTGVFTKPFEGARDEGVEGFFKGLGRGAVGLVARPTTGVVDFAAGSLDAVKRAADLSEEVTKMRAARYLPPETGVRPYSRLKAEGYKMLFELDKGKYLATDSYQAHVWVVPAKEVVLCTDKRLFYLEKNAVFGSWQIMWSFLWTEIPDMPKEMDRSIFIPTPKRKVLGLFPSHGTGKMIFFYDEQLRKYLLAECQRLKQAAG